MSEKRRAIFLIDLVQDVNVLRPLIFMASRSFQLETHLLFSRQFGGRDRYGIWQKELGTICEQTGATLQVFSSAWEVHRLLDGKGIIIAASESHLSNHATVHSIFQHVPNGFLRVTLQHGFECIGFCHSADHDRAHGTTASFGADVICAWSVPERLRSLAPSQLAKVHVTGPTSVLQQHNSVLGEHDQTTGIVCENLHSVRISGVEHLRNEFEDTFSNFCKMIGQDGRNVVLRPHPGGQYVLNNWVSLPRNVRLNVAPMYRVDLRRFAYGISGPSSVILDLLLAEIPTAVWRDQDGVIDATNYSGLTTVSSPSDWIAFADAATRDPDPFLDVQRRFLKRQEIVTEPADVFARYSELFAWAVEGELQ